MLHKRYLNTEINKQETKNNKQQMEIKHNKIIKLKENKINLL